jgi:excisionase family DNA binding protein
VKIELEETDIQTIADKVLDTLKPYLSRIGKEQPQYDILDVQGLCSYLKVAPKWVYEQTHLKAIPHYKLTGKALRFRRTEIDKWLANLKNPALTEPTGKFKLLK